MVKVMYTDLLVYKVVIWAFFGISLWKEKVAFRLQSYPHMQHAMCACHAVFISLFSDVTHYWHSRAG